MASITHDESAAVFSWKSEILEECWECILNALIYLEDDGKGYIPDLIFDDGGKMNLLIHEGDKVEYLFIKDGTAPGPRSKDNAEFKVVQTIIKCPLEGREKYKWNKISNTCMRVSEDTSTDFHHMYNTEKTGSDHQN